MDFTYENYDTSTYLVYTVKKDDCIDSMSLGMITNNKIDGLASTLFTQIDAVKLLKYNISSRVSVRRFFGGLVNKKKLIEVFSQIVNSILSVGEYMIDSKSLLLDIDYIFVDASSYRTEMICLPISNADIPDISPKAFFKDIMVNTQFDDTENSDYIAKIFNFLNKSSVFSLDDFKKFLNELKSVPVSPHYHGQGIAQAPKPEVRQTFSQGSLHTPEQHISASAVSHQYIPAKDAYQVSDAQKNATSAAEEKKIGLLGLLMHYNAENRELYKRQKANKKQQASEYKSSETASTSNMPFAVPTLQNSNSEVVPAPLDPKNKSAASQPVLVSELQPNPDADAKMGGTLIPDQNQYRDFGDTTVLNSDAEDTILLNDGMSQGETIAPYLIREKNNEKILITKEIFTLGRDDRCADYAIRDNSLISRSHVQFIKRGDKCFIIDNKSTNYTYINGTKVEEYIETEINHNDKLRLANENFEFKLY